MNHLGAIIEETLMKFTLEIPQLSLDKIPLGYQKRLEERTLFQIYEDGYISEKELAKICQKYFYQEFAQLTISSKKTITTELYHKRKRYFSDMKSGTGEWDDILHSIVSSRIDKEEPPIWD